MLHYQQSTLINKKNYFYGDLESFKFLSKKILLMKKKRFIKYKKIEKLLKKKKFIHCLT